MDRFLGGCAVTGCDSVGYTPGYTRERVIKLLEVHSQDGRYDGLELLVHMDLNNFTCSKDNPAFVAMQRLLADFYMPNSLAEVDAFLATDAGIGAVRAKVLAAFAGKGDPFLKAPPTLDACFQNCLRAFYQVNRLALWRLQLSFILPLFLFLFFLGA